jgi:hypothetical protein
MSKSIQVYVDSAYAYSGSTNNFTYYLKEPIKNATAFKITSAEIPLSYYNVRSMNNLDANNTFIFSENGGITTTTATITAGYYTSTTIIIALQTALNAASPNHYTYSISYNAVTGLFNITSTGNFIVMYSNSVNGWLSINWLLGFIQISNAAATTQSAQSAPMLDYYQYLYFRIGLNFKGNYDETGSKNNIIKIPITSPQGSIQYYFDVSDNRFDLLSNGGNDMVSFFSIELIDSDGNFVYLNGRQLSLTITFYYN